MPTVMPKVGGLFVFNRIAPGGPVLWLHNKNYKFQLTGNPLSLDLRPQKSASSMTSFELYTLFFSVILE